jgi:hypothetical protein
MSQYPYGKLNDSDEGGIDMAVTARDARVIVAFRSSVAWIGMMPEEARNFASLLNKYADKAEEQSH